MEQRLCNSDRSFARGTYIKACSTYSPEDQNRPTSNPTTNPDVMSIVLIKKNVNAALVEVLVLSEGVR